MRPHTSSGFPVSKGTSSLSRQIPVSLPLLYGFARFVLIERAEFLNNILEWWRDGTGANVRYKRKVEAAGIEPASRDLSTKASTCVAGALNSPSDRSPADYQNGYSRTGLAAGVPDVTRGGPELATDFWASPAKTRSQWLLN